MFTLTRGTWAKARGASELFDLVTSEDVIELPSPLSKDSWDMLKVFRDYLSDMVYWRELDFTDCDLFNQRVIGGNFGAVGFLRGNLSWAYLRGSNFSRADLRGTDLSHANLSMCYLSGARIHRADLSGATLVGADLRGTDLATASTHGAKYDGRTLFPKGYTIENSGMTQVNLP